MSTDLSNVPDLDEKFATIFDELYTPKGSPSELDEAFAEAYFSAIAANNNEPAPQEPLMSDARLISANANLKDVLIPSAKEKFTASPLDAVSHNPGFSQIIGKATGDASYIMMNVNGFIGIIIKSATSLVVYTSIRKKKIEAGNGLGKWESM